MRRPGDRGVDGIFALAFPGADLAAQPWPWGKYGDEANPPPSGFALTYVDEEFATKPQDLFKAVPPLPFGAFETSDFHTKLAAWRTPTASSLRAM